MLHLTAGIFGNPEFAASMAKKLGKQGTANDLVVYNHGSSEGVFTYITVNSEKIQPLLQAINMVDVPVLAISELNAAVGEQIIAISEFGFRNGFVILENISKEQLAPLVKGTCVENFVFLDSTGELMESVKKLEIERPQAEFLVPIDNYFNVKSVGTVVLGIVKSGSVKKYDKVMIEPLGKEVMIKGIQSQDKDVDEAGPGTRVGLNLKGIEADELKRGYVVGKTEKSKNLSLNFTKSKYSKELVRENDTVLVSSGLQVIPARIKSSEGNLELEAENYIVYVNETKFLIASSKQVMPRIIGSASL
jgi:selenocysteine-specific translation elongation factor